MDLERIRNFCIIAHIDHGKSTLADRLLEYTGTVTGRELREQVLDSMDLERERGITIKAQAVEMNYRADDGLEYALNLIDTPGHVDFSYEVSRSLGACEGALLVVDAAQGIEAQTLANAYLAMEHDLQVIPVVNKIDLPNAEPQEVLRQIEDILDFPAETALLVSAKLGSGIKEVLEAVVKRISPPKGDAKASLRALIFDSIYNSFRGVVVYVRVFDGVITPGLKIRMMSTAKQFEVSEVGIFKPRATPVKELRAGEVGYVIANMKAVQDTKIGDTITYAQNPAAKPLPGYEEARPVVYCGMYPTDADNYEGLKDALERLILNDSSFKYEPETSRALGYGFRCGFLGLLHMEIIQERLEREYDLSLVITSPSVVFKVTKLTGEVIFIENPAFLPEPHHIAKIEEPYIEADIIVPAEFQGAIFDLCEKRRGVFQRVEYLDPRRVLIVYHLPLAEAITDFYDRLKSNTKGYGSLDYRHIGYREGDLVKLDILLNGEPVDALSCIVHRLKAHEVGRRLSLKLKDVIPRQLFEVVIQASVGNKIIARETVRPMRKNVTAKCYGGDITRKRKLLEKQKEGKKRMKRVGRVDVPQEAFMAVLQIE